MSALQWVKASTSGLPLPPSPTGVVQCKPPSRSCISAIRRWTSGSLMSKFSSTIYSLRRSWPGMSSFNVVGGMRRSMSGTRNSSTMRRQPGLSRSSFVVADESFPPVDEASCGLSRRCVVKSARARGVKAQSVGNEVNSGAAHRRTTRSRTESFAVPASRPSLARPWAASQASSKGTERVVPRAEVRRACSCHQARGGTSKSRRTERQPAPRSRCRALCPSQERRKDGSRCKCRHLRSRESTFASRGRSLCCEK